MCKQSRSQCFSLTEKLAWQKQFLKNPKRIGYQELSYQQINFSVTDFHPIFETGEPIFRKLGFQECSEKNFGSKKKKELEEEGEMIRFAGKLMLIISGQ